jgi:hypothetical protein
MTNTLSFPSPYITLSLLHSFSPSKALEWHSARSHKGSTTVVSKRSHKEKLLTLEEHSAELLLFKRSHKEGITNCFQKRDCFHLKNTLQDHHCFKGVISESITVCSKKSHKRNCFLFQKHKVVFTYTA